MLPSFGGNMRAPNYIQKELNLIHPLYFAAFEPIMKRWHIRKWISFQPINHKIVHWKQLSTNILTIRKEDNVGNDIGYMPLDMRAVEAVKEGLYWARNAKKLLQEIDDANQGVVEKADEEDEYLHRYAAKRIWSHYREPSVFINRRK